MAEEVTSLIYYAEKDQLVVITSNSSLNLLGQDESTGEWMSLSKMKFATGTGDAAGSLQVSACIAHSAHGAGAWLAFIPCCCNDVCK